MTQKIEDMLFLFDSKWHKLFAFLLLPFSFLYCAVGALNKLFSTPKDFGIPIISIGNLTVGGSGKTPFAIELCKRFEKPCVVTRGYGRNSKGLFVVSRFGRVEQGVDISGDEAALIAGQALNASVIVSEDRKKGIEEAKKLGCDVVLLDDGFGKFAIKKVDILLFGAKSPKNHFCLPSGPFRFPPFFAKFADFCIYEGDDFTRIVEAPIGKEYALITAISNPKRLDAYLGDNVVGKYYFFDHYYFTKQDIDKIVAAHPNAVLLCTQKDGVKLRELGVCFDEISLAIHIKNSFYDSLRARLASKFGFYGMKNQAS